MDQFGPTVCMFWLLMALKDDYSQENLECSFRHLKVVFELIIMANIWERSTQNNTTHETAHTISLISPLKSSSSARNSDPTSSILNERDTCFVSGMEHDCPDP